MEQMYTSYWITVTWRRDRRVTWHVGWPLFILLLPCQVCGPWGLWPWERNIFDLSRDHSVKVSRDFAGGFLILSHHPAKFGVHRPCKSEDITFFIYHMTTWSTCHMTFWVGCLILSHHPAKFGIHTHFES